MKAAWLIWSNLHSAWWAKDRRGYTRQIDQAGLYTFEEADEVCRAANHRTSNLDYIPPELYVPTSHALRAINLHDELVEALRGLLACMVEKTSSTDVMRRIDDARAILAKVSE